MTLKCTLAAAALACAPVASWAADALHPYSNIDHRVDAGNDTGDSRVDALNQAQLNNTASGQVRWVPGTATIYPGRRPPAPSNGTYGYAPAYLGYPYPPTVYGWPAPVAPGWYW
jgi:hypothetical protein